VGEPPDTNFRAALPHSVAINRPVAGQLLVEEPWSDAGSDSDQHDTTSTQNPDHVPRYVDQTREWIEACNEEHRSACVPEQISQRPPDDVPRWLIDTHQQCIVSGLSAHQYLALSYVWPETRGSVDSGGPPPRTLLLDNESMVDFQRPGFLAKEDTVERIPGVIRHAMGFTQALGERYLWVDRLCIVQNDVGDGGTLSQVAKMDKIYAGAYLTIIAAATDEMYENGCAAEWPAFRSERPQRRIRTTQSVEDYIMGRSTEPDIVVEDIFALSEEDIANVMSARYGMLSRSRWATRGWTYQEQILCKRAVVFMMGGFFWDCHCSVWDGVDLFPGQDFDGVQLRADMGQRFSTRWWPDFSFYLDLICPYNGREFSYPQDALLGISGVLNALGKSFPGGFVHGLPRLFLDHALLWQPFGTADRRVDRTDDGKAHVSLPSWSWAGWQCYVDPRSLRSGLSYMDDRQSRRRSCSWRTRNLVQWHLVIDDQPLDTIVEPLELEELVEMTDLRIEKNSGGWVCQKGLESGQKRSSTNSGNRWYNAKESWTSFRHPIPLVKASAKQIILKTPAHLVCCTMTATLSPATVLRSRSANGWAAFGPSKISVFEDKIFTNGPPEESASPVLVLRQIDESFGGLLRLMVDDPVDEDACLELVAISKGSATARDVRHSFEWRMYETGRDEYNKENSGKTFIYGPAWINDRSKRALLATTTTFIEEADIARSARGNLERVLTQVQQRADELLAQSVAKSTKYGFLPEPQLQSWFRARQEFFGLYPKVAGRLVHGFGPQGPSFLARRRWGLIRRMIWDRSFFELSQKPAASASSEKHQVPNPSELLCEFYNVLWIERKDGIAYRRACGWVPKHVWEAHATGPVEVRLG
tara:strand:- start:1201 stop:3813 length:2613 start_codon:yes stop_codon:yes gene_type:complete